MTRITAEVKYYEGHRCQRNDYPVCTIDDRIFMSITSKTDMVMGVWLMRENVDFEARSYRRVIESGSHQFEIIAPEWVRGAGELKE